jgi:hypothetical protein
MACCAAETMGMDMVYGSLCTSTLAWSLTFAQGQIQERYVSYATEFRSSNVRSQSFRPTPAADLQSHGPNKWIWHENRFC